ncbi:hypothetical protein K443DRAFT_124165 [Laccaria amethystina LaAM-08-1]|uniref:Uncharacterized protein n=1 Tax=Laccaria amethystina LaAM-08-1 TaxID=1095629 RepID=A0A0C9WWZ6_9AGAR|nr:hypothetical protein K443DRAFT_124165 [Laccaria amethystina LaAM-08-1]
MAGYTKSPGIFKNLENKASAENVIKNVRLMMYTYAGPKGACERGVWSIESGLQCVREDVEVIIQLNKGRHYDHTNVCFTVSADADSRKTRNESAFIYSNCFAIRIFTNPEIRSISSYTRTPERGKRQQKTAAECDSVNQFKEAMTEQGKAPWAWAEATIRLDHLN